MDLRRADLEGLKALAAIWKKTPGTELEAGMQRLDLIGWQDIIQGLRALGMREAPQILKLNITLANDIRFTLEGAGVIQAYCEDNRLTGKPFTAMVKEGIKDAVPVDIDYYGVRAKLKRETPLDPEDGRIKEALGRWDSLVKYFRLIQRFEFVAPDGIGMRFDISVVRSGGSKSSRTFQEARVTSAPTKYEAEVELTGSRDGVTEMTTAGLLIRGLGWMLQGQQRSFVLVSSRGAQAVLEGIQSIFRGGRGFKYPGPQPATLERSNIEEIAEPGVPNLRTTSYNVTDKADGLRCILYVAENGRIFLVDSGGRVYGTGKETAKTEAGLVLDGEWIRRDRKGTAVSHYYAFDIMALRGSTAITGRPFLDPTLKEKETRHAAMVAVVTALGTATQMVKTPAHETLQIGVKTFRTAPNIFRDAAASVLDDAAAAPYNTDGLIFTPNLAPLPLGRGTWAAQLKWKPASHNSIDFLVIVDKERGADGLPTASAPDLIGTKFREDAGSVVRHKTLRLFVGSRKDAAFADPRATVTGGEPLPTSLEEGEYRAVEFRPSEPRDPMAAICYVAIGEGSSDPAASAPAATRLDAGDEIRCESGDAIQSNMIVEMSYRPELAPGWRWVPMRIRHDKTERLQKGAVGGTMNADWVANSIWSSIHNPISEETVKTGVIAEVLGGGMVSTYYARKAPQRDLAKSQSLRNFHNDYVKRDILLRRPLKAGDSLCDLAMGKAGDLHKWVSTGVGYVFGCDYAANNINDPSDGAYSRLLTKMIEMGGRDKVPPMVFVQADASVPLKSDAAGITPEDKALIQAEMPRINAGFDVVSCMFAIHFMFRDQATLHGFLTNLADLVKVGGYFVGCGFDGDSVARLLAKEDSVSGRDGGTDIWTITKRYGTNRLSPTKDGLGLAIDVDFISIGDTYTEYLVSWPYLVEQLASIGLEVLTPEDQAALGLTASTQMFADAFEASKVAGSRRYDMPEVLRRYSFLNRWYIFRRVADRRPVPLAYEVSGPKAPLPLSAVQQSLLVAKPVGGPLSAIPEGKEESAQPNSNGSPPLLEVVQEAVPEAVPEAVTEALEVKPLFIDSTIRAPDDRLGPALSDWPRYMSLGTLVPGGIQDHFTPGGSARFPSVEAAIAAAKYQVATDKPALGPQLFAVDGALHQKFETARAKPGANMEETVDNQIKQTRLASAKAKMTALKAAWQPDTWNDRKDIVYRTYLKERYDTDAKFKQMVDKAVESGLPVMLVNGSEYNELGVGLKEDGTMALDPEGNPTGGKNLIGKWIMEL